MEQLEGIKRVFDGFDYACSKYPDRAAIIYLGEVFTYAKLRELINRFASGIHELGVKPGDRVILYIGNSPQWVIAYLGLQKIGVIPVPVSPIYTPYEVSYMAENSRAETIICGDTNFGYALEVMNRAKVVKRIIWSNMADMLPWWKRVIGEIFDRVPEGKVRRGKDVYWFKDLLKSSSRPPEVEVRETDVAHILYTGGTTGLPKGIPHTHRFVVSGFKDIMSRYSKYIGEASHVFVFAGPLFHMFWQDMFFSTIIYRGNTAVLLPRGIGTDPILDSIQRYKATLFAGVPALYRMLLENDRFDMYDLSSLKYCWSAGDVLPLETYRRWKEKVGVPIHEVYGSTEMVVYAITDLDHPDPAPPYVGRVVSSRLFKVVDPDTLEPVPPDTPGELLVSCDDMPPGYIERPEETKKSFVTLEGRVWFRTGDYVKMDSEGNVYFIDRAADTIKYKGYRVSAAEVEAVLQDHPAVLAACVIGVPDPAVGERIKAFVVLKEDVRGVSAQDLIRWCRERLAPYKVPHYIEFRDALPKSKVGKLLRRELREEERRRLVKGS